MEESITISGPGYLSENGDFSFFVGFKKRSINFIEIAEKYKSKKISESIALPASFDQEKSHSLSSLVKARDENVEALALELETDDQFKIELIGSPSSVREAKAFLEGYLLAHSG